MASITVEDAPGRAFARASGATPSPSRSWRGSASASSTKAVISVADSCRM
jgi:hypothetical protein